MLNAKLVEDQFNDNGLAKDNIGNNRQMMGRSMMDRQSRKMTK